MNNTQKPAKPRVNIVTRVLLPSLVMFGLSFLFILYGNRVIDHFAAAAFKPTPEVVRLHDEIKLTNEGNDVLYASQPIIQTSAEFNQSCSSTERTAAILGCYYMRKLYIYNITNPDLHGAEEVTMAHEMLHAAYERLNIFDRTSVDKLVNAEYEKLKDNPELKSLMQYYEKAEPGALTNELHSILGTIIPSLSPQLEQHYARYFTNRQLIVGMNQRYNAVFSDIKKRSDDLSAAINNLRPNLQSSVSAFETTRKQLEADIAVFNQRANSGYYTTQSAFNRARQALLARVDGLNAEREDINRRVQDLNNKIAELNKLALKVNELNSSINGIPESGVSL